MKKHLLFVLAAFAFAACTQDVEVQVTERHDAPDIITVGFEGDVTRIQLNEAQKTVWTKGDQVSVFYKSDGNDCYKFTGETGARTGTLQRVSVGEYSRRGDYVVVAYPYNPDYLISLASYTLEATLPAVQEYVADSYGVGSSPMVAMSDYKQFSLKNTCGWLKLQLKGDGEVVKSITFKGNNGEQVAGDILIVAEDASVVLADASVDVNDDEVGGALLGDDDIIKSVTLDCGEGVTLGAEATDFYIALPPQSFKDGITVDVNCKGYKPMSISTQKDVIIERNHIQPMAEVAFSSEVRTIANNEIWYTATEKIEDSSWTFDTFGANIVSNEWDSVTGEGIITFDGDVACIGDHAFNSILALNGITLPKTINRIGRSAFWSVRISDITIPKSVTTIGEEAFYDCDSLTSVTISDNVTTIGREAFYHCDSLTSVTIPDSVTMIGDFTFTLCDSLTSVYCKAITPPALGGNYVFVYNGSGRKIYVPTESVEAYKSAEYWSDYASAIVGYDF